ncbi:MAG: radical SAM protein, partial [Thermoguttaceae bacterium]|nr:radical SAM protein [Thermoguttaceae bacterium]
MAHYEFVSQNLEYGVENRRREAAENDRAAIRDGRIPARWTTATTEGIECRLCARRCVIASGKAGFCGARWNDAGVLRTRFYGRPISAAIDPIEKKPLYHFLPGTPILSLGTFGCTLACRFCQNWKISRSLPMGEIVRNIMTPEEIVAMARARRCPSVAFTYNEPTVWAEFVIDVAKLCRQEGIKTVAVTNGTIAG